MTCGMAFILKERIKNKHYVRTTCFNYCLLTPNEGQEQGVTA